LFPLALALRSVINSAPIESLTDLTLNAPIDAVRRKLLGLVGVVSRASSISAHVSLDARGGSRSVP